MVDAVEEGAVGEMGRGVGPVVLAGACLVF